jgi:membrane carboxypeptidase/penicillin-binding protein
MGFDRPQRIKSNAQGGTLAAPAWTAFMREVYRRKPAPPDWPRPQGVVMREIDPRTGLLQSAYCPGPPVTEFFVSGTEPMQECSYYMSGFTGAPDTSLREPGTSGQGAGSDIRIEQGAAPMPRPAGEQRSQPLRPDTTRRGGTPPRDTVPRIPGIP